MVLRFPSNLTVSVVPLPPIVIVGKHEDGTVYITGSEGKFLDVLAHTLRFKYKINISPDREWGRIADDGKWTGMIGQVVRGESDLTLWTTITKIRSTAVDFSEPYSMNEVGYVTNLPGYLPKTYAFFYPFDIITWCCIILLIFALPFMFKLLSATGPSYIERLLYLYGTLMHQSLPKDHFYRRTLLSFWWIASLVLSVSYSGALSSFLSLPLRQTPITNFHELSVAVSQGNYRCLDMLGTVNVEDLLASEREDLVLLGTMIKKNNWFTNFKDSEIDSYFDGRTAHLGNRIFFQFKFGKAPYTSMYISDDKVSSTGMGLGVRKDFCCKEELNTVITRIRYAGIYEKLIEDEMYQSWRNYVKTLEIPEINHRLSVHDLYGVMIIYSFGNILSIIVFIVEYFFHKRMKALNK